METKAIFEEMEVELSNPYFCQRGKINTIRFGEDGTSLMDQDKESLGNWARLYLSSTFPGSQQHHRGTKKAVNARQCWRSSQRS